MSAMTCRVPPRNGHTEAEYVGCPKWQGPSDHQKATGIFTMLKLNLILWVNNYLADSAGR